MVGQVYAPSWLLVSVSSSSCRVRQVAAERSGPTICDQCFSIWATRSPASSSTWRPRVGGEDELGSPVGAIRPAFQVTQILQLADQLGRGGQAQLGPDGQVGKPDAVHPQVAKDVQVRLLLGHSRLAWAFPTWFDTSYFADSLRQAQQHRR